MSKQITHYEGCWRDPHECAIHRIEQMRDAIDWYLGTYGNGDARDSALALNWLQTARELTDE